MESIDRVCALPIEHIVLPHLGLQDEEHTKYYLSHCKIALQKNIDYILTRLQAGKTNEEIIEDYISSFWNGSVQIKYPINAMKLNTNIMINLIRKELLENV